MNPPIPQLLAETLAQLDHLEAELAEARLNELATRDYSLAVQVHQHWHEHLSRVTTSRAGVIVSKPVGLAAESVLANPPESRITGLWSQNQSSTGDFARSSVEDTLLDEDTPGIPTTRYKLTEELGRGGFGAVYRGIDLRTAQAVAVKTMRRQGERALEFFKGEFRYLQGISHPNLVQLHELASDGRDWWIAMEYVEGVDFLQYVCPGGNQIRDYDKLRAALGRLVEGITFLHHHRRLHRDIKPQNVRVTPEGRVVILDFGLTAEVGPGGELRYADNSSPGTIPYMAPEQFNTPPVSSTASDMYSIGVILYEALTRRRPYSGSVLQVVQQKLSRDPVPPREVSPDVPADLETLCLKLLARKPEDRATAVEVFRVIGYTPSQPSGLPIGEDTPLLGRDRQLRELHVAYEASRRGEAVVVKIQGPSGIGKSALVNHFIDRLQSEGAVVLSGRCYEHESVPYKALDPLIDDLARYLHRLPEQTVQQLIPREAGSLIRIFPVLGQVEVLKETGSQIKSYSDVQELRRQAFTCLRELIGRLSRLVPLVLHIDDLQWGDVDSAYLLADLVLPPNAPAVCWLLAHRSEDGTSPCLVTLADALGRIGVEVRDLVINPLTGDEIRELVFRMLGPSAAERAADLARESGGNPYFLSELIQAIRSSEQETNRELGSENLTLDGLIRSRVSRLPPGARRLLELVAVSGRPLVDIDAYQSAEGVEDVRTLAVRLEAARLLRGIGEAGEIRLETYHDRVREAVVDGLEAEVRRSHHGRLAKVLEESGRGDLEELAQHFEGAGREEKAGRYYTKAADRAACSLAFDQAAGFYRKTLDLLKPDGAIARDLQTKLADSLANAGRGGEAGPVYRQLAEGTTGHQEQEFLRKAMREFLVSGSTEEGIKILTGLLYRFGLYLSSSKTVATAKMIAAMIRLRLRGTRVRLHPLICIPEKELLKIDTAHSAAHSLVYLKPTWAYWLMGHSSRWGLNAGEPLRAAKALATVGFLLSTEGASGYKRGIQLLNNAEGMCSLVDDPYTLAYVVLYLASSHWAVGHWEEMFEHLDRTERITSEAQISFADYRTHLRHLRLDGLMMAGRWREYSALVGPYLEDGFRRGDQFTIAAMSVHSYFSALIAGHPDQALVRIRQGWEAWPQKGNVMGVFWGLYGRIEVALYRGDGPEALALLTTEQGEMGRYTHYQLMQFLHLVMTHLEGRAALACARMSPESNWYFSTRARLVRTAAKRARLIEKANMPWSNPLAGLLRAGGANLTGRTEDAIRHLARSEDDFNKAGMLMYAAAARRRRGRLLGGEEGKSIVDSADAVMIAEGVREPNRIAEMLAPGFEE